MDNNTDIKLVTRPAAARMLGISRRSLDRLIDAGTIPIVVIGRHIRIGVAALISFARGERRGGES